MQFIIITFTIYNIWINIENIIKLMILIHSAYVLREINEFNNIIWSKEKKLVKLIILLNI